MATDYRDVGMELTAFDRSGAVFNVMAYGAVGNGTTNDSDAAIAAAEALVTRGGGVLLFPGGRTFYIPDVVDVQLPAYNTVLYALGAVITSDSDALLFDINPARVTNGWDGSDTDTMRHTKLIGGRWLNTAATKAASGAVRAWGMRHFHAHDFYMSGWHRALEIAGKDSYQITNYYFFANDYDIYHPDDSETGIANSGDLPLEIVLSQGQHSSNGAVSAIYIGTKVTGLKARDISVIGETTGPQVHFKDSSLQFGEGYSFAGCHWERIPATGAVKFDDANGQGFYNVSFDDGCTMVSNVTGWKGVLLNRVRGASFGGISMRDGSAGTTEVGITADANCKDLTIGRGTQMIGVATPLSAACARSEYSVEPVFRSSPVVVTGYNTSGFSTGTATIDMSTAISSKWPAAGVPKGYTLSLRVLDSGSAASTDCKVAVQTSSGSINNNALRVGLEGTPNGEVRTAHGYVEADANGDIYIDYTASGSGTLSISMSVLAIHM